MTKALVLGCGLVGRTIALDLAEDFDVTVMDYSPTALAELDAREDIVKREGSALDLEFVASLVKEADIVVGVLPSSLEGAAQRCVIDLGKDFVSPSGFLHAEGLDELAKERGVTAVFDMGVAPGMSNVLIARGAFLLDSLDEGIAYVCGIPQQLDPPFNYRTVFCLEDTLNEYVQPARIVKGGRIVEVPAMSGLEEIDIPGVGRLEAFFTDGLRSAADNIKGAFIAEKTMRWPGYAEAIEVLTASGLLGREPINFLGMKVRPIDFAAELLRPRWQLCPERGDRDYTIMVVTATGPSQHNRVTYRWDMVDKLDEKTGLHSMARTTGFPAAITARAIAGGMIREKGFLSPESLAGHEAFHRLLIDEQKKRGVVYRETVTTEYA